MGTVHTKITPANLRDKTKASDTFIPEAEVRQVTMNTLRREVVGAHGDTVRIVIK